MLKKCIPLISIAALIFIPSVNAKENSQTPISSPRCDQFTFDATASLNPDNKDLTYKWDFGDGSSSNDAVAEHQYEKSGDYAVTLTINDQSNLECSIAEKTQVVRANIPPQINFNPITQACVNQPIALEASATTDNTSNKLSYDWNLGDGTKVSNQKKITKTYSKGGDFQVTLTVDDNQQTSCSRSKTEKIIHVNQAPVAQAGDDILLKCVSQDNDLTINFDASSSYDNNNDPLTYIWDFGDGQKAEGIKVSHTYKQIGAYEAKLIVKDPTNAGCQTGVDFVSVRLNESPKASAGEDIISCSGENIIFDGSDSSQYQKGSSSAQWSFGDGDSAKGLKVTHNYFKPGKYQATLTLESNLNEMCPSSQDTKIVNINSAPKVSLKSVANACAGSQVAFDASSANDPDGDSLTYHWNFGDGETLMGNSKVTHEYKQGGEFKISVVVDDGAGSLCSTAVATTQISVNSAPIADIGPNLTCCVEKEAEFNASASVDPDGDPINYAWDFGDGSKDQGMQAKHAFKESGQYNVTLTVDDGKNTSCSQSTANFLADVSSSPVPVINIR